MEYRALQDTLYVLGGKWKIPIINAICNGSVRFRDIERCIPGITTRMLSRQLKELELNHLVTRKVHDTLPVKIEYQLTDHCRVFGPVIREMIICGIEHRKKITARVVN